MDCSVEKKVNELLNTNVLFLSFIYHLEWQNENENSYI